MNRLVPRTLLALAATAVAGLIGPTGCAENRSSFYVVGVLAKSEDCSVSFDPGQPRLDRGLFDVLMAGGGAYAPPVLLGNQYIPLGNNNQIRTETSRIQLRGAEVRLSAVAGGDVAHFTTPTSGTVDPAPSATPGFGGANVMMIPPDVDLASGEYLAEVRVFGRTLGGQDIETTEFIFPITVCHGCSVTFSADSKAAGDCIPEAEPAPGSCRTGQDGPTDCGICQTVLNTDDPTCLP